MTVERLTVASQLRAIADKVEKGEINEEGLDSELDNLILDVQEEGGFDPPSE